MQQTNHPVKFEDNMQNELEEQWNAEVRKKQEALEEDNLSEGWSELTTNQ